MSSQGLLSKCHIKYQKATNESVPVHMVQLSFIRDYHLHDLSYKDLIRPCFSLLQNIFGMHWLRHGREGKHSCSIQIRTIHDFIWC